jgi:hypothetical protein
MPDLTVTLHNLAYKVENVMEKVRALCRQTLAAVVRVVTTWQTALQARLTISSISRSKKVSTTSCRHTNKVPQLW